MNEPEVRKIFMLIQNTNGSFDYDDDKVLIWVDLLREVPFEMAQRNLRQHLLNSNYIPVPADIAKAEEGPSQIALYHDHLRDSAQTYIALWDSWQATAAPPPDEIKAIFRLPEPERSEALKEYARVNRDRLTGETAGT